MKDLIVKLYVEGLAIFIICVILLIMISFIITASWQFLDNVYLTIILFKTQYLILDYGGIYSLKCLKIIHHFI